MKGIIFTEFIEMVESRFGYGLMDEIIESSNLPSRGIYTAVGTYSHTEMVQLVTELSTRIQKPTNELLKNYGQHLFKVLANSYPHFFENISNAFDFFEQIDAYIHFEVQKLYPDAELPKFETKRIDENTLEMLYLSERKMADLAEGLIIATLEFYTEKASVSKENINSDGSVVKFRICKV